MKKTLINIILLISILTLVGCKSENNTKAEETYDGKIVGISNSSSDTKLQIKITNDYINIRKEKSVNSDIVGVVKKDSIYDVIDYEKVGQFFWVHIKTNNNLDGYVASYEDNIYYDFINGDIDFLEPKLEIKVKSIDVDSYSTINDEYINSIITYSDDKDPNPKLTYNVSKEEIYYYMNIAVSDSSNNIVEKKIPLNVKNEKLASNGKWLNNNDVRNLRKKFLSIITKYGRTDNYTFLNSDYWTITFDRHGKGNIGVFTDSNWTHGCYFIVNDNNIAVEGCFDELGTVSYDEIKSKITSQEKSAKQTFNKVITEFAKTGYNTSDLYLFD